MLSCRPALAIDVNITDWAANITRCILFPFHNNSASVFINREVGSFISPAAKIPQVLMTPSYMTTKSSTQLCFNRVQ